LSKLENIKILSFETTQQNYKQITLVLSYYQLPLFQLM